MVMYPLFSRDQEDRHLREDELVVLVEKRYPRPHDAAVRAGRRGLFLNDFQHQAQRVARIDRLGPAKLINADAEDAGGLHHAALHGQLHGDRGGVPAARHQPLEGAARGGTIGNATSRAASTAASTGAKNAKTMPPMASASSTKLSGALASDIVVTVEVARTAADEPCTTSALSAPAAMSRYNSV